MELHEIISSERILRLDNFQGDKSELLKLIFEKCDKISSFKEKRRDEIWETLIERENSMSTGIGLGVAIPHCSTEYVDDVIAMLAVMKDGIDFQAIDDVPVQIIVLLLLPKNKFEKHIKTLASVARLFNNEEFRSRILNAENSEEIYAILQGITPQ